MNTVLRYTYKFKGRFPALVACGFMIGLFAFFAILIGYQKKDVVGGATFCLAGVLFFLLIGFTLLIGKSNIDIDSESISRTIFGKRFKTIRWNDVERVSVFSVRGGAVGSNVTGYNVIAARDRSNLSNTRKIFFSDQGNDLSDLIEHMNIYIARFDVKVERESNGTKEVIKSI